MVDSRIFTGGLNQDTADEFLQPGDYKYAMNIDPGPDGVTKLFGNIGLDDLPETPDGVNWVCGSFFDRTRQNVYYFIFNSEGYHRIVLVDINIITPENSSSTILFEDRTDTGGASILGWGTDASYNPNKIIKDIKIIYRDNGQDGDLVYFIDPLKRPLKFNTVKLPVLASTNDVILDYFKVIKSPPSKHPICNYYSAPGRSVNNLRKKLFQFKSRFVYDDDEKSVWSAVSISPLPPKANDEEYYSDGSKSNAIQVSIQTGSKIVKKIELSARVNIESSWSNYFLVDTIDKSYSSIPNNSSYTYTFFNDGAYLPIEIEESNLLFDYVPDKANALELANGNTLIYGGIEEGLSREVELDVSVNKNLISAVASGYISIDIIGDNENELEPTELTAKFSGFVIADDSLSITINIWDSATQTLQTETASYTFLAGDVIPDIVSEFFYQLSTSSYFTVSAISSEELTFTANPGNFFDPSIGITYIFTSGATSLDTESIPALKWKGRYKYGIAYYNHDGKTNGVFIPKDDSLTVDVGQYYDVGGPTITEVELSINNAPPSWSEYFQIVRTKELTSSFSKFFVTKGVDNSDLIYPLINIENIVLHGASFPSSSGIINYTSESFVNGDRIRFIKDVTNNNVLANQKDYEILGIISKGSPAQQYIKIRSEIGLPPMNDNRKYLIEIYRPSPVISDNTTNFYYEIGARYSIYTDTNGNKSHTGITQNQIIGTGSQPAIIQTFVGDYYVRNRDLVTGSTATDITTYPCMDTNFSDFWESAVWGQGRPLIIDESAKSQYFPALIRFSQSFIQGTNINSLNRFYPENFEEADNSFGDILRLKTRENFIRLFQRYKVGMIPIYRSIIVDNAASSQVAISERLLNKPNYYAGEYGIDKYGSSLVSTDYGDYFIDTINRAIIRVSLDGMTNISDTYNMAAYANGAMNDSSYGYGYFNYETRSVVILVAKLGQTPSIISYSESRKNFESFHGYTGATSFQFVNGHLWSFYEKPYVHNQSARNNFYGVQQSCSISTVFNGNVQVKKTYMAIELLSTELWSSSMQTGPLLNQQTTIEAADYAKTIGNITIQNKENKYNATIKRDMSSAGGKYFGDSMKGNFAQVALFNSTSGNSRLISVSLKYIQSPLTNT
jgi:hypothetical protein